MNSVSRYKHLVQKGSFLMIASAVVIGSLLVYRSITLPRYERGVEVDHNQYKIPLKSSIKGVEWDVFQSTDSSVPVGTGVLAKRFRLAGTFFGYNEEQSRGRKAILDDITTGEQSIVSENSEIDEIRVIRIFHDRVVLRGNMGEEELWLSFQRDDTDAAANDTPNESFNKLLDTKKALETNRFGKRVGRRKWVFKRDALLDYYQEVMDEPERLYYVFESMKPLYDDNRRIKGYWLGVEGNEGSFFKAVGLEEGDIVRKVNSTPMSNRRIAESFIRQFVQNKASAFVIDIERDGKPEKLIYHLR